MKDYFFMINKGLSGIKYLFAILLIFIVCSCVTTQLPEQGDKCKSILVICTDLETSGGFRRFSYFELAINGYEKKIDIIPSNKYIVVSDLNPGTYTTSTLTMLRRLEGGYSSNQKKPEPQKFNVQFTLEPGKITFFPVQFIYEYEESSMGVRINWNIDELTPEMRVKKTLQLKKEKTFSSWEIQ
jgi:hypothetical protein